MGFSLNGLVLADEQSQPFLLRYGWYCSRAIFWLGKWLHCWSMIWCVLEPKFGFASTAGDGLISVANSSIFLYYVLTSEGTVLKTYREYGKEEQVVIWRSNQSECDVYGICGEFGICHSGNSPICSCLRGFEPKDREQWSKGNWTGGCVRKTPLQCQRTNSSGEKGKLDEFFRQTTMKVPDFIDWSLALEDECREQCLRNCSCIAYSYYRGTGCMSWSGNLIDLRKFTQGGADLFIRLAHSALGKNVSCFLYFLFFWLSAFAEWDIRTPKLIKHLVAACIR